MLREDEDPLLPLLREGQGKDEKDARERCTAQGRRWAWAVGFLVTVAAALVVATTHLRGVGSDALGGDAAASALRGRPASRVRGRLNVHLVPHTHDDVGWLKTVDQYFAGTNASIYAADVRQILSSVVDALERDPSKTFVYAEMAFFSLWWREQSPERKASVRALVEQGRLSFVNGGWCMHDEAASHYADMIDQTALGHAFIRENFGDGAVPRVGWQLDPFGHSAVQASHLGSGVGLEAVFFGRADRDDVEARVESRALEFTWRGSPSLGAGADIKGFVLSRYGNYGPPPGHCYDAGCVDDRWQDDPRLGGYNVPEMVDRFVAAVEEQSEWFAGTDAGDDGEAYGGDIMLTMGEDFTYGAAAYWFDQMDRLIRNVNAVKGDRLHLFYSTPASYLDAKRGNPSMNWPLKVGDFFPYHWTPHQFWTGYFSSRPTLKAFIRSGGEFLRAAKSLQVLADLHREGGGGGVARGEDPFRALSEALGVAQHHDAVSGTAKQHVTNDYAARISKGLAEAEPLFAQSLVQSLGGGGGGGDRVLSTSSSLTRCPLLNVSSCEATETLSPGKAVAVLAWNPLAWARVEHIRLPVPSACSGLRVLDAHTGQHVASALLPAPEPRAPLAGPASHQLAFSVSLPPLSVSTFTVQCLSAADSTPEGLAEVARPKEVAAEPQENPVELSVDPVSGRIVVTMALGADRKSSVAASISVAYYRSHDGSDGHVPSGAYVFRPDASQAATELVTKESSSLASNVVDEVRVRLGDGWAFLTCRVWHAESIPHAEVEWTVGPIPVEVDGTGKEAVLRYSTGLETEGKWATDSNGRDMQLRRRNHRDDYPYSREALEEPVSSNYYPFGSVATLIAEAAGVHLLTDRSQGVASLQDGELEAMVHRRNLNDDWLGVGEPMNETQCGCRECDCPGLTARGTHLLAATPPTKSARAYRELQQRSQSPVQLAFSHPALLQDATGLATRAEFMAPDGSAFPKSVHVLSLEKLRTTGGEACGRGAECVLVRLAHLYESKRGVGFDEELSMPAKVDLSLLFPRHVIATVEELTLSGTPRSGGPLPDQPIVTLEPMQIRALKVTLR